MTAKTAATAKAPSEALLQEIAAKHFHLETLETRNSDGMDFHDVRVWSIRAALEAAFAADPAQHHQIEQDTITAAWEAECLVACDDAIVLLREIADLERDDDGNVIIGADANGRNDMLSRITALHAEHDH